MARALGRGRYLYGTYPQSAAAGGGPGGTIVPLSRQRFIDGDTTQPGLDGSAANPFKTIAEFISSRGNASVDDATANYVGWITPSLAGYAENVAFPAYASTELRGDSFSVVQGTAVTGNVTWANIAGANVALEAIVAIHNVLVFGSFTVTDDGGAPQSAVFFGGDEAGPFSVELTGGFDSSTTTNLGEVAFSNAIVASGINCGTAASSATLLLFNTDCSGDISAKGLDANNSFISATAIAVNSSSGAALFLNTQFAQGSNVVLDSQQGAKFDGPSWRSFVEAGGSRSASGTGTWVLVQGGYSGGEAQGAQITSDSSVSLNGLAPGSTFTGNFSGNSYQVGAAPTSVTLLTGGGELDGDTMLIYKPGTTANAVAVKDSSSTTIATIPTNEQGYVLARFSVASGDWVFLQGGALA